MQFWLSLMMEKRNKILVIQELLFLEEVNEELKEEEILVER